MKLNAVSIHNNVYQQIIGGGEMSTALKRGLKILDIIAKHRDAIGFNELNRVLGDISRASLSRLLKMLVTTGYLHKDPQSGLYSCGYKMAVFANVKVEGRGDYLISTFGPLMKAIAREYNVTTVLLERVNTILINIRKEQTPFSAHMQDVGNINDDLEEPWLQTLAAFVPELESEFHDPEILDRIKTIRRKKYYYEDQTRRHQFRRIAFPLFDRDGIPSGILGIGGSILQLTDENVNDCIEYIVSKLNKEVL